MYRRILVPLDGSERAEKVLPVVKIEAECHQATVVLLRVIPPLRHSLMTPPALLEETTQQVTEITQNYLEGVAKQLRAEGLEVETEMRSGAPAQRILDFAENNQCDLIVIGSRGDTGALQWRFGSVANKVIKTKTTMPVLVVST
jgi:nucleotide-binding universal stress UspA family protein